MSRLSDLTQYIADYRARTLQLADYRTARTWMEIGIDAVTAASWARAGYTPAEALPRIAARLTPGQAADADAALIAERGIIGYTAALLQLDEPGATLIVDPDAETVLDRLAPEKHP